MSTPQISPHPVCALQMKPPKNPTADIFNFPGLCDPWLPLRRSGVHLEIEGVSDFLRR